MPEREMSQKPCTIIRDALSISPSGIENTDSPLIDVFDIKDVKCSNPQVIYPEQSNGSYEVIARTVHGSVCGFSKAFGRGTVIHLGTWIGFDTEAHRSVYETILKRSDAKLRQSSAVSDYIVVRERFTDKDSAVLFIGNYYNEEQFGNVMYTHPQTGETIPIPYSGDKFLWPALYGVLSPVCLDVCEGIKILHSTSDILFVEEIYGQLEITLYGNRDLGGEIVFEGANVGKIQSATLRGKTLKMFRDRKRTAFSYSHKHKTEMILTIVISDESGTETQRDDED